MAHIILDIVIDEPLEEYVTAMEKLYDLKLTVLQEIGPAGGWPVIKFEGHKKRIEAFLRVYTDHDTQSYQEFFEDIVE